MSWIRAHIFTSECALGLSLDNCIWNCQGTLYHLPCNFFMMHTISLQKKKKKIAHQKMISIISYQGNAINKTTVRYHFMPNRIARIKKYDNKCWQGFREIRTLRNWWQQCKNGTATLENSLTVPQKPKCVVTLYSAVPLLRVYPRGMKTYVHMKNWT